MKGRLALITASVLALSGCGGNSTREIRVVGSSTVYPFTTAVAEAFVNAKSGRKAPVVESIGSGAGIRRFCEGVGAQFPDIANASRRMTRNEYDRCQQNQVGGIMEITIGLDGVALAESNDGPKLQLTKNDIYLALAANPRGKPNTARTWRDVNPALPPVPILVMGPPSTSGTRDAFVELMLEPGCIEAYPEAEALKKAADPAPFDKACRRIREDGPYVDKGENDNLIVQGLAQNPNALGIFGYSYLEENQNRLHGVPINGVAPTYQTIADGQYPGARPLFLYVKKRHMKAVPGLKDFLTLYTTMWGPGGPLAKRGLIAAPEAMRVAMADRVKGEVALDRGELR
ncbi:substrate-binding domain-containing protein [Sphingomonas sp. RS6]